MLFDLKGKLVIPEFVEPDMRLAPLAMLRSFENVGPFRFEDIEGVISYLTQIAENKKMGDWILGCHFDPYLQGGPEYLIKTMLDLVSSRHPVFIYNASLHIAYCNSLALDIAGITKETVDRPGSEITRDEKGEANGVLKAGPVIAMVARHNPGARQDKIAEACLDVLRESNKVGTTVLCDQGTGLFQGMKELDLYEKIRINNRMSARLRFSLGHAMASRWEKLMLSGAG